MHAVSELSVAHSCNDEMAAIFQINVSGKAYASWVSPSLAALPDKEQLSDLNPAVDPEEANQQLQELTSIALGEHPNFTHQLLQQIAGLGEEFE